MQSLEGIKKRIQSIGVIKKMTHAMRLVASVKFKKQAKIFKQISDFCHDYYSIIGELVASQGTDFPLLDINKQSNLPNLYIIITGHIGLCGSYNNNICKMSMQHIKPEDKIIVFGKKGYLFFKNKKMQKQIIENYDYEKEAELYFMLAALAHYISQVYLKYQYKKVYFIYTKFISSLKFMPTRQQVLPIPLSQFIIQNKKNTKNEYLPLIEPNAKEILQKSIPIYITNLLYGGIAESIMCQYASQKNVMDGASKNASELIDQLKLTYNRLRQESITHEINEIISGTNSNR